MKVSASSRDVGSYNVTPSCDQHCRIRCYRWLLVIGTFVLSALINAPVRSQPPGFIPSEGVFHDLELKDPNSTSNSICSLFSTGVDFPLELPNKLCSDEDSMVVIIDNRHRVTDDGGDGDDGISVELMMNRAEKIAREAAGNRFPDAEIDSMIVHVRDLVRTTEKPRVQKPQTQKILHLFP